MWHDEPAETLSCSFKGFKQQRTRVVFAHYAFRLLQIHRGSYNYVTSLKNRQQKCDKQSFRHKAVHMNVWLRYPSPPAVLSWNMTLSNGSLILIEENSKQIFSWNRFLWQILPHLLEKLCFKTNPIFSWYKARCPFISRPHLICVTLTILLHPFPSFPVKAAAAYLNWESWCGPIEPVGIFPAIEGMNLPFGPP